MSNLIQFDPASRPVLVAHTMPTPAEKVAIFDALVDVRLNGNGSASARISGKRTGRTRKRVPVAMKGTGETPPKRSRRTRGKSRTVLAELTANTILPQIQSGIGTVAELARAVGIKPAQTLKGLRLLKSAGKVHTMGSGKGVRWLFGAGPKAKAPARARKAA